MYRYIEKNKIQQDSHKYITSEGRDGLSTHKLTNCGVEYDLYCCSDCTKSLCLDNKMKINVLEKLHLLVKTVVNIRIGILFFLRK